MYYFFLLDEKLSEEEAFSKVHRGSRISKPLLEEILEQWECHKIIRVTANGNRGFERSKRGKAPLGTSLYLKKYVDSENEAGRSVTAVATAHWLASEPQDGAWDADRIPVHVSHQTVSNWLHKLGYTHREGKKVFAPTEQRKARIREYLIDLAKARAGAQKDDGDVLVYMDESYVHVNHKRGTSWFTEGQGKSSTPCNGSRVIIVHAITEDGPLVADSYLDDEGIPKREGWFRRPDGGQQGHGGRRRARASPPNAWQDNGSTDSSLSKSDAVGSRRLTIKEEPTCEMLFPAGDKTDGDYHKNMDADVFMKWVEKRLVPAFKARYGDRKMVLILDNAAYHHGMADGWKSPLKATKDDNTALLQELGAKSIDTIRNGKRMRHLVPARGESFARAPKGPTVDELQKATFVKMKKLRPDDLLTRAERFFKERGLGNLLYTPPYSPDLQPIELFWADAKNYVAKSWTGKPRSMLETTQVLRWGFYGKKRPDGTWERDPIDCGDLVRHTIKVTNEWIERDEVLSGTIDCLKNVPEKYKVSKESGLDAYEDDPDLFDVDMCE